MTRQLDVFTNEATTWPVENGQLRFKDSVSLQYDTAREGSARIISDGEVLESSYLATLQASTAASNMSTQEEEHKDEVQTGVSALTLVDMNESNSVKTHYFTDCLVGSAISNKMVAYQLG